MIVVAMDVAEDLPWRLHGIGDAQRDKFVEPQIVVRSNDAHNRRENNQGGEQQTGMTELPRVERTVVPRTTSEGSAALTVAFTGSAVAPDFHSFPDALLRRAQQCHLRRQSGSADRFAVEMQAAIDDR